MFRLLKSLILSITRGVVNDPEVRKLFQRYPRLVRFLRRRLSPNVAFGLHLTIGGIITLVCVWFFFGVLQEYVGNELLIQADVRIITLVQIFRTPLFNAAMLFVTDMASGQLVFLGWLFTTLILWLRGRWREGGALGAAILGGEAFIALVKYFVARPRPALVNALMHESSFSFPSGHAFVALLFYGLLAYYIFRSVNRWWVKSITVISAAAIVVAVGFSRIYLGVHWPSDVLASYAAGAAWLAVVITALEIQRRFFPPDRKSQVTCRTAVLISGGLVVLWVMVLGYWFTSHLNIAVTKPILGSNQTGDPFFTDGRAYLLFLK